jgi:hypothetical protein
MKLEDIKVGMRVKVCGREPVVPETVIGNVYRVKKLDDNGVPPIGLDVPGAGKSGIWWFDPDQLEPAPSGKAARIRTEKIWVDDTKCRKVLGFEGILGEEDLPEEYTNGSPAFYIDVNCPSPSGHVFRDNRMYWLPVSGDLVIRFACADRMRIDVGAFGFTGIHEGSIWPETTWQELLKWMKAAGSRLAAINRRERDSWKGEEVVEI